MKPYTGKAFLYIEDGEVVANEKLMPKPQDYLSGCFNDIPDDKAYFDALAEWESQHIEVENWYYGRTEQYKDMYTVGIGLNYYLVANGQPCQIENGIVTKIY